MSKVVILTPLFHRDERQIAVAFKYNESLKTYIKSYPGMCWSQTHKTYYIKDENGVLQSLFKYFQAKGYYVNYRALKDKRLEPIPKTQKENTFSSILLYKELPLELRDCLKQFIVFLKGKRYSKSTISTYGAFVLRYIHYNRSGDMHEWNFNNLQRFIEDVIAKEGYSISSHRQCVSALKLFCTFCNFETFDASLLERPKKSKYLPTVLSKEQVIKLIQVTKNLKHRTIICLLYSSGLRISELLHLQVKNLDFDRSQILVKQGKGRKDRVVVMSEVIKPLLYNYIQTYVPNYYFIEGRDGGIYSDSAVRKLINTAAKTAKITKRVSPHTLRHSYATHMLENGVDLRYIQDLLGHAKPETTMIYTHVAQKDLMNVRSPLDVAVDQLKGLGYTNNKVLISRNIE
ncbi:site-specific tyrosine recombinase/integron integrase [Formosa haliotis]|uniref:site-specific tyrosine recombinase/integron integrase n=1 Tax=Formosa haliotis TaxID=1555194 RepID=UPI000824BB97|nr:site-specific tyrosine recombinase/integron integrase [Formosa haliotis]